jgi:hypothetical protein
MVNHTRVHSLAPDYALTLVERLMRKARPEGDCWVYTGELTRGYGRAAIIHEGREVNTYTHRVMWLALRGDLPPGLVLDHRCVTPACMNPWHLDPVTLAVNVKRGVSDRERLGLPQPRMGRPPGAAGMYDKCRRGHDMTDPYNVYYTKKNDRAEEREVRRCFTCAVGNMAAMRRLPVGEEGSERAQRPLRP